MPEEITLDMLVAGLNQYAVKFAPQFNKRMMMDVEWENEINRFRFCEHSWVEPNTDMGDILQPYQSDFTPQGKGEFSLSAVENILEEGKGDLKYTMKAVDQIANTQLYKMRSLGEDIDMQGIIKYIIDEEIAPKISEELSLVAWAGERVEPTEGQSSPFMQTFTGLKPKIEAAIDANKIVEIPTGTLSDTNILQKAIVLCWGVPAAHRLKKGTIRMAATRATQLAILMEEAYKDTAQFKDDKGQYYYLPFFNKRIIGMVSMEGSDRMILEIDTAPSWIIGASDRGPMLPKFRFEKFERSIKIMGEFERFYGLTDYRRVFVNDQP